LSRQIVLHHHERWDGNGYPHGLQGDAIPLSARLMGLVDVYDALRSPRPYKSALSHEDCVAIIRSESGKHFDPRVVEAFLLHADTFRSDSVEGRKIDEMPKGSLTITDHA
jgi:putative two-component system response regulator